MRAGSPMVLFLVMAGCGSPDWCPDTATVGWSEASHAADAAPDYDRMFPRDRVQRLDIAICSENFEAMVADLEALLGEVDAGGRPGGGPPGDGPPAEDQGPPVALEYDPVYVPAVLTLDGRTWPGAGVRFKGNSSLRDSYLARSEKMPLRLDTDRFDHLAGSEDQRVWGFEHLVLNPGYSDPSCLRDVLAAEILEDLGVPAARTAFYGVWVDVGEGPEYWGLYTLVEDPDGDGFLDRVFGDDGGNLYKPEQGCADWTCFDAADFAPERGDPEAADVEAAIEALLDESLEPEAWRAGLEARFDADGFLRWLATSTFMGSWDSYGNLPHNYYLYGDPTDGGRLAWIPWDHNMSLQEGKMPLLDLDLADVGDEWPLIRRLVDDPEYLAAYRAHLQDAAAGLMEPGRFEARAQALQDLVWDWVAAEEAPYTQLTSFEDFEGSVTGADGLVPWIESRHALLDAE